MAMVARWKCVKEKRITAVRQFYLYCIGLMIECQTLEDFKEIFSLTCIVALNEYQDSKVRETRCNTVLEYRRKLEACINTRKVDVDINEYLASDSKDSIDDEEMIEPCNEGNTSRIRAWVDKVRNDSQVSECDGAEVNAFYFPELMEKFI